MLFYFTATGNSLYAAKQLDDELISIPQELNKTNRHYKADKIGIVCPLYEFEVPGVVKKFIEESEFDTDYFYLIITYGKHHGSVAARTQEFLKQLGKEADYINTLIMVDNALIVFDMEKQKRTESEKRIDEHLKQIKADIDSKKHYIQEATEEETAFRDGYVKSIEENGPAYTFPLYKVEETCSGCGTCTKVCPMGCITIEDGKVTYDYTNCVNCMACIQACPSKAIQFATIQEPNPNERYRNSNISLKEIIEANQQKLF